MIFHIHIDSGDMLVGHLVPDGFTTEPVIRLIADGQVLGRFPCTRVEPWFVQCNRHKTGRVGFDITEDDIPGLADFTDLTILDDETGIPIYNRRVWGLHLETRIFRLDTSLLPAANVDNALRPLFQYWAVQIEKLGIETCASMFTSENVASLYLSGRVQPRRFLDIIEKKFESVLIVNDPVYELVLRCAMLARSEPSNAAFLTTRERGLYTNLMETIDIKHTENAKALRRFLATIDQDTRKLLSNPLARQLANDTPDSELSPNSIVNAMDTLSQFSATTLAKQDDAYTEAILSVIDVGQYAIPKPKIFPGIMAIAEELRSDNLVQTLLETDLILYHYIESAIRKGIQKFSEKQQVQT